MPPESTIPAVAAIPAPPSGARPSRALASGAASSSVTPHDRRSRVASHSASPQKTWTELVRTPVPNAVGGSSMKAASTAPSTSCPSASVSPSGSITESPGWSTTARSGPASDPRIRMNPHGAIDRLTQCPPDPERPNATASCDPRTSSGTTIRAPGAAWCSQGPRQAAKPPARASASPTPTTAVPRFIACYPLAPQPSGFRNLPPCSGRDADRRPHDFRKFLTYCTPRCTSRAMQNTDNPDLLQILLPPRELRHSG